MKTNLVNSGVCCQCGSKCFGSEKINKRNHLCNGCRNTSIRNEHNFNNFTLTGPNKEKFGKPEYMSIILMSWLQMLRGNFAEDQYFNIHNGYAVKGHSPTGKHPKGEATDLDILNISLGDAYRKIDGVWQGGLGVYPEWNTPGFHLDCGPKRRWIFRGGKYRKIEDSLEGGLKPGEIPIFLKDV